MAQEPMRRTIRLGPLLAFLIPLWARPAATFADGKAFLAGAATSNITPPLGVSINGGMQGRIAANIHDELHARCLVLDDGSTRIAIAVCDACMIPRDVFDEAKRLASEKTGIPVERMLFAATHTHEAPASAGVFQSDADEAYKRFLAVRIADGVRRALANLAPTAIGWGTGKEPAHVFNRRWRMKPGAVPPDPFGGMTDQVKMNPAPGSPDLVEPAGPTDPEVSIVSVKSPEGRPIALLGNYSLHYVGGERPGDASADYYGMFADRVEELLRADRQDPPFVGILSNGTSGDVNNIDFRTPRPSQAPYEQMRRVAHGVAAEAVRVARTAPHADRAPIAVRQAKLELRVRKPRADELSRAKAILAGARGPILTKLEEVYARETVLLAEYPDKVELILQALRIGDLAILAVPCEVFAEIGLDLKGRSPFAQTFTIELANGYNGYLPTPAQHALGGYETWRARSSYLEVEAAPKIVAVLLGLLDELKKP